MQVYNKSAEKSFIILKESVLAGNPRPLGNSIGPKQVYIEPDKTVDLQPKVAKALVKMYPTCLMITGAQNPSPRRKKAKQAKQ